MLDQDGKDWHGQTREYLRDHCTVDFLFDWFGLVCFANKQKLSVVIQLTPKQSNRRSMVK
jgi:hypothetical protein